MRFFRHLAAGARALLDRRRSDRDLADEVEHFYAEAEAELVRGGVPPEEARRRVRLQYGDPLTAGEDVRGWGWENVLEALWIDARIGLRRLRRSPGFTLVAALTLAIGIGSATAIFSVVRPVMLEPLGYPNANRIVLVMDRTADGSPLQVTFGTYREITERTRVFDALAVARSWAPIANGGERPEPVTGLMVSARYFDVLGVPPVSGPGFDAAEDRPGGAASVVISDGLWHRMYEADPAIVGATIRLSARPYTVVGIMPPEFEDAVAPLADVWTLLQYDPALTSFDTREWGHHLTMIGRAVPGMGVDGTLRALERVAEQPRADFPRPAWSAMDQGFDVRPLREAVTADARPTMLALIGAVGLLLAIACANVTVLILAWGARREGEFAMRVALGAGRARLIRQLLVESLVLAALGGLLAVVATSLASAALTRLVPPGLQPPGGTTIDGGVFLFSLAMTSVVGIVVGLVPALALSKRDLRRRMRRDGGEGHRRVRRALVVTEVALAVVLLVGAGLLVRSVSQLFSIPVGLRADGLVVMQIRTVGLGDGAGSESFFDAALNAVRRQPGVESATMTSQLPLSGEWDAYGVAFEDVGEMEDIGGAAARYVVAPGYFETMGIPLSVGRTLNEADVTGAPPAVVVSESLANRAFGSQDPIGRRLHIGRTDLPWYTVVGVAGDVKQAGLGSTAANAVYVTPEQWYFVDAVRWIAVRANGDPGSLAAGLRSAVWSVDPDQAILRVETMDRLVSDSESRRRFVLTVLRAFGVLALMLAAIGLYGVLSRSVAERLPELGVRAALGAPRQGIAGLVLRQGLRLTLAGIILGLGVASVASRALSSLLFGVSSLDPVTYLVTATILGVVAVAACLVPAMRASRVDPLASLKAL